MHKLNGTYMCDKCYKSVNRIRYEKRRACRNNLISDLTESEWKETLQYFNNSCAYCKISDDDSIKKYNRHLEQEHIIPLSQGGAFVKNNIIPSCRSCNSSKYNKSLNDFFISSTKFTQSMYDKILLFIEKYKVS